MFRILICSVIVLAFGWSNFGYAQCCSAGSASPVAGGTTQGVLSEKQFELSLNFQHINSDKFMGADTVTQKFLEVFDSKYLYARFAYGVTKKLTLSLESGYYIKRKEYALDYLDTVESYGIGDIIIFPRYNIFNKEGEKSLTEVTLGIGMKIPVGKYNDSLLFFTNPTTGQQLYMKKSPAVQPSTGSNDFIFYGFFFKHFYKSNFKLFMTLFHIQKGWNAEGEKFGNFSSIAFFTSKNIAKNFNAIFQCRVENIGMMKRNPDLPFPNYTPEFTGGKKISVTPQLNYTFPCNITVFASGEIPLYQYYNGIQVATKYFYLVGLSYRFCPFGPKNR